MILEWLKRFGYLTPEDAEKVRAGAEEFLAAALAAVKAHLDLPEVPDPQTLLEAPRCGCPDVMPLNVEQARWRKRDLTYRVRNYLPAAIVPQSVQDGVFAEGVKDWSSKLDITFKRVGMDSPADITIFAHPIDGVGRVLAQAQLPNGSDSPLWLQFDSSEQAWSTVTGSREANLHNVFRHELGHNLGHYHNPDNRALMYAMANSNLPYVTELDVAASVALGYPRRTEPVPPDVPPVPVPPVPGGFNMKEFVDAVLKLLNWRNQTWAERLASVVGVLDLFRAFFEGKPEPAPAAVAEMTTTELETAIREQLPTIEDGGEVQAINVDWAATLWPLIRAYLLRVLAGL